MVMESTELLTAGMDVPTRTLLYTESQMKIDAELNLAAWPKIVEFTYQNISEFCYIQTHSSKVSLKVEKKLVK